MMEDSKRALSLLYDVGTVAGFYFVLVGLTVFVGGFEGIAAPFWALKAFKANWPDWWIASFAGCGIAGAVVFALNPFRSAGEYGSAKWATEKEVKAAGLREKTGAIIGKLRGQYLRFSSSLSAFIIAPPGSGKTAGIVIPTLLSCGDSLIALDWKDELRKKTSARREQFSRVMWFAPGEDGSSGWNPLSAANLPERWEDRVIIIDRIAAIIYAAGPGEKAGSNYFLNTGRRLFVMFAQYLLDKDGETSIPKVRAFALSGPDPQKRIAQIADTLGVPLRVKEEGYTFAAMADRQWSGVWDSFAERLDVFADPRVHKAFERNDFSLEQLRKERITVYVHVRPDDIARLTKCIALFLEAAALSLISRERAEGEQQVRFINEEFARLPPLDALIDLPALSRGYGVSSLYIFQSWSQAVEIYGEQKARTLKNSCAFQVYFAQNEVTIAEDISRSIGPRTRKKLSFSTAESRLTRNTSETNEGVPLVTPQDVLGMKQGEILILRQNHFPTPIKAKDASWYRDRAMRDLVPPEGQTAPAPAPTPALAPAKAA